MTNGSERKRTTATSFGAAADDYLASDVHSEGADLERLAEWCRDATTVLDVATGAGHTAGAVVDRGVPKVVAVDASPEMVETATSAFDGVHGVVGDAERLPFEPKTFDAVSCRIAAHHFPDPATFVDEVARVLRPGGTFAFEDNVAPEEPSLGAFINRVERLRDPTHVEAHTTARWREWVADAGFAVEDTRHLKKTLEFDSWTSAQSVPRDRRARLERELTNASDDAAAFFEIRLEDESVRSFANLKVLIRARRTE